MSIDELEDHARKQSEAFDIDFMTLVMGRRSGGTASSESWRGASGRVPKSKGWSRAMKTNKCPACETVLLQEEVISAIVHGDCPHCGAELDVETVNAEFTVFGLEEEDE